MCKIDAEVLLIPYFIFKYSIKVIVPEALDSIFPDGDKSSAIHKKVPSPGKFSKGKTQIKMRHESIFLPCGK